MASSNKSHTYRDAGFNGFLRRTIASDANSISLSQMARSAGRGNTLNFDTMQVSGSLGDTLDVGNTIHLDGINARIDISSPESTSDVILRMGNVDE